MILNDSKKTQIKIRNMHSLQLEIDHYENNNPDGEYCLKLIYFDGSQTWLFYTNLPDAFNDSQRIDDILIKFKELEND